ncbi:exopolysaccharide biosynthesis polyprenyl glycosylphosphotransferase [Phenylobacterium sp.]|uniref:exopolysaccharide biosynthesis polyprenyl glycosylphosphotransferase n=1 Tax=Phenylobacterium sp. TaxID=1871053 RepID=UPI002736F538|nr:exopolysaccharide biosynthesis polyprenyl glycosylphosphotransferase [Phenylobacterium sp.]MDP3660267.1 exopolysaccharide biosynthesis polyprenyl glycosylphosphotransferase [Phenylobacterium sp.]
MRTLPLPDATAASPSAQERRGPMRPGRLLSTRKRLQGRAVAWLFRAGDAAAMASVSLATSTLTPGQTQAAFHLLSAIAVLAALGLFGAYDFRRSEGVRLHLSRVAAAFLAGAAGALAACAPLAMRSDIGDAARSWIPLALLVVTILHLGWWLCVRRWRVNGRLAPNIVVVGATGAAERLIAAALDRRQVNILGVFDDRAGRAPGAIRGVPVLGDTKALIDHRIMPYVDRVVITVPPRATARVAQLIERLRVLPNEITLLLEGQDQPAEAAAISRAEDVPLAYISGPPADALRPIVKRAQDLVIGVLALLVAAPVMAVIAALVRLDSPGPVLFSQRRHGFNNEEIVVWKFRTMRADAADATAARQVRPGDERVTRLGRVLRATSLDELPQLFNVVKGEMSLVGPRPHAVGMKTGDVESARLVTEYAHRHRMKPGMTGWAAIKGSRGPVDTPESVRVRVALDVEYIERQSLWLDLYILTMTLPCLLGDRKAVR